MECIDATKFALYTQDMLSGKEKEDVEKHLRECNECREDFAVANALLEENELELLSEEEIQAIWDKLKQEMAKVWIWVTKPIADLMRENWFAPFEPTLSPVRSKTRSTEPSSIDHIHFTADIRDFKTEMYLRKDENEDDKISLKIKMPDDDTNNIVRITLTDAEGSIISSRSLKHEPAAFENLSFGDYHLIFYAYDNEWNYSFEIDETGINEKDGTKSTPPPSQVQEGDSLP